MNFGSSPPNGQEHDSLPSQSRIGYSLVAQESIRRPIPNPNMLLNETFFAKAPEPPPQLREPCDLPPKQDPFFNENEILYDSEGSGDQKSYETICMKCRKEKAINVCVPCGHRIFCAKCSEKIPNDKSETCPLCHVHITAAVRVFSETSCCVCGENECSAIFLQCGHKCCCYPCALRIWEEKSPCPICRKKVVRVSREYPLKNE